MNEEYKIRKETNDINNYNQNTILIFDYNSFSNSLFSFNHIDVQLSLFIEYHNQNPFILNESNLNVVPAILSLLKQRDSTYPPIIQKSLQSLFLLFKSKIDTSYMIELDIFPILTQYIADPKEDDIFLSLKIIKFLLKQCTTSILINNINVDEYLTLLFNILQHFDNPHIENLIFSIESILFHSLIILKNHDLYSPSNFKQALIQLFHSAFFVLPKITHRFPSIQNDTSIAFNLESCIQFLNLLIKNDLGEIPDFTQQIFSLDQSPIYFFNFLLSHCSYTKPISLILSICSELISQDLKYVICIDIHQILTLLKADETTIQSNALNFFNVCAQIIIESDMKGNQIQSLLQTFTEIDLLRFLVDIFENNKLSFGALPIFLDVLNNLFSISDMSQFIDCITETFLEYLCSSINSGLSIRSLEAILNILSSLYNYFEKNQPERLAEFATMLSVNLQEETFDVFVESKSISLSKRAQIFFDIIFTNNST